MAYVIREKVPDSDPVMIPAQRNIIDTIIQDNIDKPGATMVVLNELQAKIGFVSEPMQEYVAKGLNLPPSTVHGVVSFYSFFTTEPRGKHTIKFCMGTACYVGGMPQLIERTKQETGIEPGHTTEDGEITLEVCRCVGACSKAPVIVVDDENKGRVSPSKIPGIIRSLRKSKSSTGEKS